MAVHHAPGGVVGGGAAGGGLVAGGAVGGGAVVEGGLGGPLITLMAQTGWISIQP